GLRACLLRVDVEPVDPLIRTDERHLRPLRWPVAELPDRGRRGKDVAPARTDLLPRPLACPLRHLVRELLAQEAPPVERVADRIEDRRALCLAELVCLVPRRPDCTRCRSPARERVALRLGLTPQRQALLASAHKARSLTNLREKSSRCARSARRTFPG